jgi:selenocysteine lyase/cysteine desulfurase
MLKSAFSRFFAANPALLHAAAHSHHPWPDVALAAHARYAEDSIQHTDRKWDKVLGEVLPEAQRHIARQLNLRGEYAAGRSIAFAPNTGEFVARLYSALDSHRPIRVLTTRHEFHSFGRATRRLSEDGRAVVTHIPAEPEATFVERFAAMAATGAFDLVFFSHVFFDSGFVVPDLARIVAACPDHVMVVIDGYHAFMAIPIDFAHLAGRAFYLAGGYKYAMAGEGACWLHVPGWAAQLRPVYTGWFADFAGLASTPRGGPIGYADDGYRFFGATFDASGLYRFNAVQRWLEGVPVAHVHTHVQGLQERFLAADPFPEARRVPGQDARCGNFLTFETPRAEKIESALARQQVYIDRRGTRVRVGFGVYHRLEDIDDLLARVAMALR